MEPYVVSIIPIVAAFCGWMVSRMQKLAETQAATVSKLESIVEEHNYLRTRVDALTVRG